MDKFQYKTIQNVKVLRGTDTGSDHYLVKIKIKLTPYKKKKTHYGNKTKFDPSALNKNYAYYEETKRKIFGARTLEKLVNKIIHCRRTTACKTKEKHQWSNEQ